MQNLKRTTAVFVVLIAFITTIATVKAQQTPEIFVTWPGALEGVRIYEANSIGETFQTNINISFGENISSWEIKLRFDSSLLVVSAAQTGGYLGQFGSVYPLSVLNQSDFGFVVLGETFSEPAVADGNGTLVKVTFTVLRGGRCALTLYDTLLYDDFLNEIPHTTTSGTFFLNILTLTPSSGTAAFIIEGYGFNNNTIIREITWDDEPLKTVPKVIETDFRGDFETVATVPESAVPGSYTIEATDSKGQHTTATFTLLSIQGPEGPAGPEGIAGDQGEQGPAGPAGPAAPLEYSLAAILLSIIAIIIAIYVMRK